MTVRERQVARVVQAMDSTPDARRARHRDTGMTLAALPAAWALTPLPLSRIVDADVVINAHNVVVKDRHGPVGRQATADELVLAEEVR